MENIEKIERKISVNDLLSDPVAIVIKKIYDLNSVEYADLIRLERYLNKDVGTVFTKKEVAWFLNNHRFWFKIINNTNARRIFLKLYSKSMNLYALSKEMKIPRTSARHWFNKFKSHFLIRINPNFSYGNETLYYLDKRTLQSLCLLTRELIIQEQINRQSLDSE